MSASSSTSSHASSTLPFAGSIELQFAHPLIEGQYKLVELSPEILSEIETSIHADADHPCVELRGAETDEAALVTKYKTYSVRLVESSNTQLLVDGNPNNIFKGADDNATVAGTKRAQTEEKSNSSSPNKKQKAETDSASTSVSTSSSSSSIPHRTIRGMVSHHYECIEILPRLHVLRELISKEVYEEGEDEGYDERENKMEEDSMEKKNSKSNMYTLASLRRIIQSSDNQLYAGLSALDAFIDRHGYYRMMNPDYVKKIWDSLMELFVEKQKWLDGCNIDVAECAETLKELYPKRDTEHVIRMYSKKPENHMNPSTILPSLCTLDHPKVCLFYAIQLLSEKDPYPHAAFMANWKSRVPSYMASTVDVALLRGHALCEVNTQLEALSRASSSMNLNNNNGNTTNEAYLQWRYFPLSSLSPLVKTRFQQLFDARAKWKLADIESYTMDLCTPGQTLEQLLLKQTRPITQMESGNKIIVYTRR